MRLQNVWYGLCPSVTIATVAVYFAGLVMSRKSFQVSMQARIAVVKTPGIATGRDTLADKGAPAPAFTAWCSSRALPRPQRLPG
jgi:hypothetical protein